MITRRSTVGSSATAAAVAAFVIVAPEAAARPRDLVLREVDVELPGAPSAIVPADLDGDGRQDLVIVVAYTRWGSVARDRVEDAVAVTEVVPTLFDRREIRAFLARTDGGFRAVAPFDLPPSWIALARGSAAHPVIALTEDGIDALAYRPDGGGGSLAARPLVIEPSAMARGGVFLADLPFVDDVDGDGRIDAVIPARGGIAIHRGTVDGGFEADASYRARLPGDQVVASMGGTRRLVPVPRFLDADGDGTKDLVVPELDRRPQRVTIARGVEAGRFAAVKSIDLGCLSAAPVKSAPVVADGDGPPAMPRRVAWFGDLDGDGRPEVVTRETVDTGKSDRKQATSPMMRYRFHRLKPDLSVASEPYATLDAQGYAFTGSFRDGVDLEFLDLDGDGRKDLVTVTLDVSMFKVLLALSSKKIGIGLDFRVFAQGADGGFKLVPDQLLTEKLNVDLNRLEISRLGQFQGDFDGDGRVDFVHLGRGRTVTIHRGQPGCLYAPKPDVSIELDDAPQDVMLVRVRDFDGDGRSDIAVTRTTTAIESGDSAPVTLELRLSGEARP